MDNSMYPPAMQLLLEPRSKVLRSPKFPKGKPKKITLKCFPGKDTDEETMKDYGAKM